MTDQKTGGGAATAAGVDFQARTAAWVAVHILAEQQIDAWDVGKANPRYVHCETNQAIDDILVGYALPDSDELHHAFLQAKHSAGLAKTADSPLASFLDQCVRQYRANRDAPPTKHPWTRKLDPQWDRFTLVVGPNCSRNLAVNLPRALSSLRKPAAAHAPDDAADTAAQQEALDVVNAHVRRSWLQQESKPPTDDDVSHVLALVRIQVLDADPLGQDEVRAKDILRSLVVQEEQQVNDAWQAIVTSCIAWQTTRSGADLPKLQDILQKANVRLKRPRSIQDDAEKLLHYSHARMQSLQSNESFIVLGKSISIPRLCEPTLEHLAEHGSVLVLGKPGDGKSAVLSRFARKQLDAGHDVILLRADNLPGAGPDGLRAEIGMTLSLPALLQRWPGTTQGYLVIDALDAARTERSTASVQQLIEQVQAAITHGIGARWKVVASIREYDLRHNQKLRTLFRGAPSTEHSLAEFKSVRHVQVAPLAPKELDDILARSQSLAGLYSQAGEQTRKLLLTPFNMTLAAELLGSKTTPEEIKEVRTQVELLNLFWAARVEDPQRGLSREAVLREIVEQMVGAGVMRLKAGVVTGSSQTITDLLHNHLLTLDAATQYLSFPHHILFDYTVARLILRGEPSDLAARLESRRELALTVRPSLSMHFTYLWTRDDEHGGFWQATFELVKRVGIPEVGKTVASTVAAELFASLIDLHPVLELLRSGAEAERAIAAKLLMQVVAARSALPIPPPVTGAEAAPWCALAAEAARSLGALSGDALNATLQAVVDLLRDSIDSPAWTQGQLASAGEASRLALDALLRMSLKDSRNRVNLPLALKPLCHTFSSDPGASIAALRPLLAREAVAEYGYQTLPWIAYEIEHVISAAPEFAGEVYKVVFEHDEKRQDSIPLGQSGGVIGLNATVAQSYDGARYSLSDKFADFASRKPLAALDALLAAVDAYVADKNSKEDPPWRAFVVNGRQTGLRRDLSCIWDEGDHGPRGYDALPMVDDFFRYLHGLCAPEVDPVLRHEVVAHLLSERRTAMWWRRLLITATECPETLGSELRELTWNPVLQTAYDTMYNVGQLISVIYDRLTPQERERIERTILDLPNLNDPDADLTLDKVRARLMSCVPSRLMATDEARKLREELETTNTLRPNMPLYTRSGFVRSPYTEDDRLRDEGIPPEAERTKRVKALTAPVEDYVREHRLKGAASSAENIAAILRPLYEALTLSALAREDDALVKGAWSQLEEAAELAAAAPDMAEGDDLAFLRTVLINGSHSPWPEQRQSDEDDESGFVSVGPRWYAAGGLVFLLRALKKSDAAIWALLEHLAFDPARSVRIRIAENTNLLLQLEPDAAWALTERMAAEELKGSVLAILLQNLHGVARSRPEALGKIVSATFERWKNRPHNGNVCAQCVFLSLRLWLDCGQDSIKAVVDAFVNDPGLSHDATHSVLVGIRENLVFGPVEPDDPHARRWRLESLRILERVLDASMTRFAEVAKRIQDAPEEDRASLQETARSYAQHIDTVSDQIYFGSGAFDTEGHGQPNRVLKVVEPEIKKRFFQEASGLLRTLGRSHFASTIHNAIKTLAFLADVEPKEVLLLASEILKDPANARYVLDSLARDAVFEFLDGYLATQRALLVTPGPCQTAFMDVLDTFVKAGHPKALAFAQRAAESLR